MPPCNNKPILIVFRPERRTLKATPLNRFTHSPYMHKVLFLPKIGQKSHHQCLKLGRIFGVFLAFFGPRLKAFGMYGPCPDFAQRFFTTLLVGLLQRDRRCLAKRLGRGGMAERRLMMIMIPCNQVNVCCGHLGVRQTQDTFRRERVRLISLHDLSFVSKPQQLRFVLHSLQPPWPSSMILSLFGFGRVPTIVA